MGVSVTVAEPGIAVVAVAYPPVNALPVSGEQDHRDRRHRALEGV